MKLIGHIVKKDLRRFWFGIVILAGLVAFKFFLADLVFHLGLPALDWNRRLQSYQLYLLLAEILLSVALAVGIVQEDSVPDLGAFCHTLPITRRQLLAAKLLGIVLVCVLPIILPLSAGWLLLGLPADQLGWPLIVAGGAQLGLGLIAFAFGSLTKNAGHLLFWMLGTLLAFVFPAMIIEPTLHRVWVVTPGTRITHIALFHLIWISTGLAVIFNQYLARSRRRSIIFLGTGVLLALAIFEAGHTRLSLDLASTWFSAQRELNASISRLEVGIPQADVALPKLDADDALAVVLLHMTIADSSPTLLIEPQGFYGEWPRHSFFSFQIYRPKENPLKRAAEHGLGFGTDPKNDQFSFGADARFSPQLWSSNQVPFAGQIDLSVYQTHLDGELPLTKGASLRSAVGTTKILEVAFDSSSISVDVESRLSSMGVDPGWIPGLDALAGPVAHHNLVLVSKKTKTVVIPSGPLSTLLSSYAYGADLARVRLAFILPKGQAGVGGPADWVLIEISTGDRHRSIRSFQTNVLFHEVPAITRDPEWFR